MSSQYVIQVCGYRPRPYVFLRESYTDEVMLKLKLINELSEATGTPIIIWRDYSGIGINTGNKVVNIWKPGEDLEDIRCFVRTVIDNFDKIEAFRSALLLGGKL